MPATTGVPPLRRGAAASGPRANARPGVENAGGAGEAHRGGRPDDGCQPRRGAPAPWGGRLLLAGPAGGGHRGSRPALPGFRVPPAGGGGRRALRAASQGRRLHRLHLPGGARGPGRGGRLGHHRGPRLPHPPARGHREPGRRAPPRRGPGAARPAPCRGRLIPRGRGPLPGRRRAGGRLLPGPGPARRSDRLARGRDSETADRGPARRALRHEEDAGGAAQGRDPGT